MAMCIDVFCQWISGPVSHTSKNLPATVGLKMLPSQFCPTSRESTVDLPELSEKRQQLQLSSTQIFFSTLVSAQKASAGKVCNVR